MHYRRLATIFILFLAAISLVYAASNPQGPQVLDIKGSQRNNPYVPLTLEALAGNLTELDIQAKSQTRTWQGYFGNISGKITLDDASNWTMYDWANTEPRGQIYATPQAAMPIWENISCFDYYGGPQYNLSAIEADLGLQPTENDGVNETFRFTTHDTVYVGSVEITTNTCPSTYMYQGDLNQTNNFQEILLTDNSTGSIIYTALIENRTPGGLNDLPGYNNYTYDFQMLVGEDGHGTDIATTTYWFYVELI